MQHNCFRHKPFNWLRRRAPSRRRARSGLLVALALIILGASGLDRTSAALAQSGGWGTSGKQAASEAACVAKRKAFSVKWSAFQRRASTYWSQIVSKRTRRRQRIRRGQSLRNVDYVQNHPPIYKGPKWPKCKLASDKKPRKKPVAVPRSSLPTVADFLRAAKKIYGFEPRRTNERGYKSLYANEALQVGLTADQVVGVYALETGGIGPYARQSGIFITDQNCRPRKAVGRAASTALGYAQLLSANSSATIKLQGPLIAAKLARQARRAKGSHAIELQLKSQMVMRMRRDIIRGIRKYRKKNGWREYVGYGKTRKGLAVHALNLDADIGPILQVYKLLRIKKAAARKGFHRISGAQMELMNLVGYGKGLEMIRPVAARAPSSNFFSRKAYSRNPLAKNLTAHGLLQKIDRIIVKRKRKCGAVEFLKIFDQVRRQQNRG